MRVTATAGPGTAARRLRSTVLVLLLAVATLLAGVGAAPAEAASTSRVREVQQRLTDLGYPVGKVDGVDGPRTRQGLCAWRRLSGATAHRGPVTSSELTAIRRTSRLPVASKGRGATVDKTCQVVYDRERGRWRKVLIASTGTCYPSATPNMYRPRYIHGAIALHGSTSVPPRPASHGCVRLTVRGADWLFARMKVGDPVKVIGAW